MKCNKSVLFKCLRNVHKRRCTSDRGLQVIRGLVSNKIPSVSKPVSVYMCNLKLYIFSELCARIRRGWFFKNYYNDFFLIFNFRRQPVDIGRDVSE